MCSAPSSAYRMSRRTLFCRSSEILTFFLSFFSFRLLLVLLKLGKRKASTLGMALSTLLTQVTKLPVPQSREQEQDDVFGLCCCCTALSRFVRPFVEEIKENIKERHAVSRDDELRVEILKL